MIIVSLTVADMPRLKPKLKATKSSFSLYSKRKSHLRKCLWLLNRNFRRANVNWQFSKLKSSTIIIRLAE